MKILIGPHATWVENCVYQMCSHLSEIDINCHPAYLKEEVNFFLKDQTNKDTKCFPPNTIYFTCNNIQVLNLLPSDCIYWIDKINPDESTYTIAPFWEVFSAFKGIDVGDVFWMFCNGKFPRHEGYLKEGKIKYLVPELDN